MELFSPHLLIHGVVEPCSAKSLEGSGPVSPFLHIVQHLLAACWILSQDKLADIVFDVNNTVPLRT